MQIYCLVKRVLDYQSKFVTDGKKVYSESGKFIINPFDEIAVEEAIRKKEQGICSRVTVVSVGSDEQAIRYAMSMGADDGVLLKCSEELTSIQTSQVLVNYFQGVDFSVIFAGKQAIDTDSSQVAARVAAGLGCSFAAYASKIDFNGDEIVVEKEVDDGIEVVSLRKPCVITVDLRLNTPRFPPLPAVLKAKQKPLEVIEITPIIDDSIELVNLEIPAKQRQRKLTQSVEEFVNELKRIL